jgi:hypothetical protein
MVRCARHVARMRDNEISNGEMYRICSTHGRMKSARVRCTGHVARMGDDEINDGEMYGTCSTHERQ